MTLTSKIKKLKKEDSLLNAAFILFTRKGVAGTSVSEITQLAGVAKGTFYLYFKDKHDIYNHLVSHKTSSLFRDAQEKLAAARINVLEDRLVFLADCLLTSLEKDRTLLHFISKNLSWGVFKTPIQIRAQEGEIDFRTVFQKALEASPVKYRTPEIMLYLIVEFLGSSCYRPILYQDPWPLADIRDDILRSVRRLIRSYEIVV